MKGKFHKSLIMCPQNFCFLNFNFLGGEGGLLDCSQCDYVLYCPLFFCLVPLGASCSQSLTSCLSPHTPHRRWVMWNRDCSISPFRTPVFTTHHWIILSEGRWTGSPKNNICLYPLFLVWEYGTVKTFPIYTTFVRNKKKSLNCVFLFESMIVMCVLLFILMSNVFCIVWWHMMKSVQLCSNTHSVESKRRE
jgi:hypothetical protein